MGDDKKITVPVQDQTPDTTPVEQPVGNLSGVSLLPEYETGYSGNLSGETFDLKKCEEQAAIRATIRGDYKEGKGASYMRDMRKCRQEGLDHADAILAGREVPPERETVKKKRNKLKTHKSKLKQAENRQTDQNYIIQNMLAFSGLDKRPRPDQLTNLTLVSNYAGNLSSKLSTNRKLKPFFNMTPLELSSLVPHFKIFKREKGKLLPFQFADRYNFNYRDLKGNILSHKSSYGGGVGLKGFRWTSTGQDTFTADKTFTATLSIHFQSLMDLAKSARDLEAGPNWQDLIIPDTRRAQTIRDECGENLPALQEFLEWVDPYTYQTGDQEDTDKENAGLGFSLVVEVGWDFSLKNVLSPELREAIKSSRVLLNLSLTDHNIKFRDDGSVDIDINYIAGIDYVMGAYAANIFHLTEEASSHAVYKKMMYKREQAQYIETAISDPTGLFQCMRGGANTKDQTKITKKAKDWKKEATILKKEAAVLTRDYTLSMYGKFVQFLTLQKRMFFVDVPMDSYAKGILPAKTDYSEAPSELASGFTSDLASGKSKEIKEIATGDKHRISTSKFSKNLGAHFEACHSKPEGVHRVYFFYLGDLINFYAGALPTGDEMGRDRYEIVLGDLEFLNYNAFAGSLKSPTEQAGDALVPTSLYRVRQNMAYVPVSMDGFNVWFTEEVTNKGSVFTFKDFITSLVSKLVVGALQAQENQAINKELKDQLKSREVVKSTTCYGQNIYLKRGVMNEEKMLPNGQSSLYISPVTSESTGANAWMENREFLVLASSYLPWELQIVDEEKNAEDGLFHFKIGVDRGIVKDINMTRAANAGVADWNKTRAMKRGTDPGLGMIRSPYQATVTCFGVPFITPGGLVYINPTNVGLGDYNARYSIAREIGIGGFYVITKVSTQLAEGKLETTLDCVWHYFGRMPGVAEADKPSAAHIEVNPNATDSPPIQAPTADEQIDAQTQEGPRDINIPQRQVIGIGSLTNDPIPPPDLGEHEGIEIPSEGHLQWEESVSLGSQDGRKGKK